MVVVQKFLYSIYLFFRQKASIVQWNPDILYITKSRRGTDKMSSLWRGYVINETQLYNESMGKVQNLTSYQSLHVANASDYIALGPFQTPCLSCAVPFG